MDNTLMSDTRLSTNQSIASMREVVHTDGIDDDRVYYVMYHTFLIATWDQNEPDKAHILTDLTCAWMHKHCV